MKDRMIQNGIEYERRGEQYYPLLDLGEQTSYEIGKYGNLHLDFIKKYTLISNFVKRFFEILFELKKNYNAESHI